MVTTGRSKLFERFSSRPLFWVLLLLLTHSLSTGCVPSDEGPSDSAGSLDPVTGEISVIGKEILGNGMEVLTVSVKVDSPYSMEDATIGLTSSRNDQGLINDVIVDEATAQAAASGGNAVQSTRVAAEDGTVEETFRIYSSQNGELDLSSTLQNVPFPQDIPACEPEGDEQAVCVYVTDGSGEISLCSSTTQPATARKPKPRPRWAVRPTATATTATPATGPKPATVKAATPGPLPTRTATTM